MSLTEPTQNATAILGGATTLRADSATAQEAAFAQDVSTLATGAGISLAGKLTGRGIHLISQIVLARLLGPAAFGLYAIGWTLLRIVGVIAPLGLDRGVIRFAPQYQRSNLAALRGVLLQSLGIGVAAGGTLGAAFYLAAPWLAARIFGEPALTSVFRLFALAFPLYTGLRIAAAATRVTQRMQFSALAEELAPPVGNLLLIILFYALGWHLIGAVAAAVISLGLAFALAIYYVRRLFREILADRQPSPWLGREMLTFSLPASLAGMFTLMTLWVDRLLVAYFRPAAEVGLYQAASQSAMLFAVILGSLNAVLAPMISDLYHRNQRDRLQELYRVSTKWTLYLCLPLFLVIAVAPRQVMTVVFGGDYSAAWPALLILAAAQMVNAATGAVGLLLLMTGYQNRVFWVSFACMSANIVLNLLFIPRWGITGAAVATALAVSGLFLFWLADVRRFLRLWPYDRRYLKSLLAVATGGVLLFSLHPWLGVNTATFFSLVILTVLSIAIFAVVLLIGGLDREDGDFLDHARNHLRSAFRFESSYGDP